MPQSNNITTNICLVQIISIIVIVSASSSGYDSIECDPQSSRARTGRARLIASIPCDLSKQSFCNLPGEFYPWNAVKKFVYENQGLVRRMYGDLRHIFVMQSELENDIEFDDMQHIADKYSKAFNTHNTRQNKARKITAEKNLRSSDAEPHFRPARPSAVNTKQRTKPPKISHDEKTDVSGVLDNKIDIGRGAVSENSKEKLEKVEEVSSIKTTKLTTENPSSTASDTLDLSTTEDIINHTKESDSGRIHPNDIADKAVSNYISNKTEIILTSTTTAKPLDVKTEIDVEKLAFTLKNSQNVSGLDEIEQELEVELLSEILNNEADPETSTEKTEQDKSMSKKAQTTTMETQLYQDTIIKDKDPVPIVNRRGVNACPVKEEVVAPFWGNNTRGEVLALLNVYPFEQYINWEKCTHENEQMYCRDGCRCEQQYRLHRLLAYNPLDACRGIFSDWFRFPSCCICKCYDIPPFDYRVTSRSPRRNDNNDVPESIFEDNSDYENEAEDTYNDEAIDTNLFDPE